MARVHERPRPPHCGRMRRAPGLRRATLLFLAAALASSATAPTAAGAGTRSRAVRGEEAVAALGDRLEAVAAQHGKSPAWLARTLRADRTLGVGPGGSIFCSEEPVGSRDGAAERFAAADTDDAPFPLDETFRLHSRPGARRVVYLDFDGHVLSGTVWNSLNGGRDIACPPFDFEGGAAVFTVDEATRIQQVWERVAEDYAPFDVDVTTEYPGEDAMVRSTQGDDRYGTRVLVSPISGYFGNYGGYSYIGVFNSIGDYYKPALVFPEKLEYSEKYVGECCSHEAGHNLGLYHDGTTSGLTYYTGHGSGETGWAPIMGSGHRKNLTQWSKGEYAGANNTEDDLAIIQTRGLDLRPDDHGDAPAAATTLAGPGELRATGVIEHAGDTDVFALQTGAGTVTVCVAPAPRGPDADLSVEVRAADGSLLASANPLDLLSAGVTATAPAGTVYVAVTGTGLGDPATGYSAYGSLGGYSLTATAVEPAGGPGNVPPTALAVMRPSEGYAPMSAFFDGTGSSDPDGGIVSLLWEFGDGSSAGGPLASHLYAVPGTYTARLTVADDAGALAARELRVVVRPDPGAVLRIALVSMEVVPERGGLEVRALVRVTTPADRPVGGVRVAAEWGGAHEGAASGTTSADGLVRLRSGRLTRSGDVSLSVTGLAKPGYVHDPSLDRTTGGSVTVGGRY